MYERKPELKSTERKASISEMIPSKLLRYASSLNLPQKKTIVITGGNSGIGFEVARYLCHFSWNVILAVRNMERGEKAKAALLEEFPNSRVEAWHFDASKSASIESFCKRIKETHLDIDVFYCNAGIYRTPFELGEHGIEQQAYTNFVSNYLLFRELKEYFLSLGHPMKWILTSSITARLQTWNDDDFHGGDKYHKGHAYARSKVAVNHLYLYLKDECQGTSITPLLVHPGITHTALINKAYHGRPFQLAIQSFMRTFFHSPTKAALCTLYLLQEKVSSPCFCGPRGIFHWTGYPTVYPLYLGNTKEYRHTIERLKDILAEKEKA